MPRIVHFDISVSEPEKAIEYYSEVFGWEIMKWGGPMDYWLVTTGPDGEPGSTAVSPRLRRASLVRL